MKKGGGKREYKVRKAEALDQKHCEGKTTTTSSVRRIFSRPGKKKVKKVNFKLKTVN